jgi:hypothetical protein
MRALAVPLALLIIALIVALVLIVVRGGGDKSAPAARWVVGTESKGGVTRVLVRHLAGDSELGRQVVGTIPDDAEGWDERYHAAMAEARSRAAALNSDSE